MDPVTSIDAASQGHDLATHTLSTAGGGGLVAAIVEFFRGREARKLAVEVALLRSEVNALHNRVDALDGEPTGKKKRRQRR